MLDCDLYNNAVNENPSLKAKILDSFIEGQQYCAADKSGLQETFEENAITTQRDIEYKEYLEQDVSIARQTYLESEEIIVPEDFGVILIHSSCHRSQIMFFERHQFIC